MDLLRIIIAILVPPLGVLLQLSISPSLSPPYPLTRTSTKLPELRLSAPPYWG